MTPAALEQLVHDGYSLAYGARFLKRVIDEQIKLPISQRWTQGHVTSSPTCSDGTVEIEVDAAPGGYPRSPQPPRRDVHQSNAACSRFRLVRGAGGSVPSSATVRRPTS